MQPDGGLPPEVHVEHVAVVVHDPHAPAHEVELVDALGLRRLLLAGHKGRGLEGHGVLLDVRTEVTVVLPQHRKLFAVQIPDQRAIGQVHERRPLAPAETDLDAGEARALDPEGGGVLVRPDAGPVCVLRKPRAVEVHDRHDEVFAGGHHRPRLRVHVRGAEQRRGLRHVPPLHSHRPLARGVGDQPRVVVVRGHVAVGEQELHRPIVEVPDDGPFATDPAAHLAKQDLDHHLLGLVPHVHKARHSERAALHDRLSLPWVPGHSAGGGAPWAERGQLGHLLQRGEALRRGELLRVPLFGGWRAALEAVGAAPLHIFARLLRGRCCKLTVTRCSL
mmetsp:Transcript_5659/g.10357  ORF Transcript_5659/g.10357 Transcript_5659/m.10357 type:complete len:334 (-) Transcript_5659:3460-4461(-)